MAKRNESVLERVYGVGPADRRRDRGALLLSSALGCSLLIAAAPGAARAQSISQTAEGDITITQDVVNGEPSGVTAASDLGNVTIDVGQVNVTNNGTGTGYGISAVSYAADKLVSISVDEVTATGAGRIFGVVAQADASAVLINAGAIEATGDGGYGIWGATGSGAITITTGNISTTGGIRVIGEELRPSYGVWALTESGPVSVTSGSITTAGVGAAGVMVQNAAGDVTVDSGVISTAEDLAAGINASGHNIIITSDEIETLGDGSPGIYVPVASGDVTIDSGTISTAGGLIQVGDEAYVSPGIAVVDGENVTITSDQITTTGDGGFGIAVEDVATVSITSGQIDTSGDAASGITAGADGAISITSESITTAGEPVLFDGEWVAGEGIFAETNGPITIDSGAISTQGALAHGIFAEGGEGAISINSGTVTATGDSAHGILAAATSGDIVITAGTTATSGDYIADAIANPYQYYPDAITALTESGDISITSQSASADGMYSSAIMAQSAGGGDITIDSVAATSAGDGGVTIYAISSAAPGGEVTVVSGSIVSSGDGAGALTAIGSGDVTIQSGSIVSTGAVFNDPDYGEIFPTALYASSSHGDVSVTSDSVSTTGDRAVGILAIADTGAVSVTSGSVTTQSARGIMVEAAGDITVDSGVIQVAAPEGGAGAHAIMVTAGEGAVNVASDEIVVEGPGSHGIYVANAAGEEIAGVGAWREATGGTGALSIDSGSINSSGWGMMIDHQGVIDISSGSIVSDGPGIYLYGGDAITIDSGSIETQNGPGIVAWGDDGLVTITSDDVLVGEGGDVGVVGRTTTGDVIINAGVTETTATGLLFDSYTADAVFGWSDSGDITITSEMAKAQGLYSSGILALTGGNVSITSGAVENGGRLANGILAVADGSVTIDSGSIAVTGQGAWGLYVEAASAAITSDSIVATGERDVEGDGLGLAVSAPGAISIDSGSIHTAGEHALAMQVAGGEGDISIASDEIVTTGANAHAIYVANAGGADVEGVGGWRPATGGTGALTIDSGSIESAGWGMMIDHQGAIDITSGSLVSSGPGIYLYGGDAVTIDSGSVTTGNGPGIVVRGDDGAVSITSDDVLVGENGDVGVFAQTTSGDISIDAGNTTTTATGMPGYSADGVRADSESGNITIVSGAVATAGLYSNGVYASTDGDISITSGSIINTGELGSGILAFADGAITVDSGSIEATGAGGWGMYVAADGAVSVVSDSVVVTGEAHEDGATLGMQLYSDTSVDLVSGLVSTLGDEAAAIAVITQGDATISSEQVTTAGESSAGIAVFEAANAYVTSGDVTTTGIASVAVMLMAHDHIDLDVVGDINSEQFFAMLFEAGETGSVDINVGSGASVFGAMGAIVLATDTDTTLTAMGHLGSDAEVTVRLAGGDDVVNLGTGANIEGALDGGAGIDALNLNSTINVAGTSQTLDDVLGFETITVANGRWTLQGAATADTAVNGGTLVVTGTLTDDVVVAQGGTLQIGNGGVTGDLIGDLVIGGTAIFNRSDDYDFGGDVSGAGSLVKEGASSLILSGAYDFTGATVVNGGTIKILQLPDTAEVVVDDGVLDLSDQEQELASLSGGSGGQVNVDGGALTVNQSGSTTFGGSITGDGSFNLTGGGEINLTGNNTYTGPTTIEEGTLRVNGSITSNVTVDDGGVLGGSGQIGGDVNVGAGGIVGPGNSPGTLTVAGDFTFEEGSIYVAEVEANGDHDQIDVSGATVIEDGVTLQILAGNGDYARLTGYTLLTSASITGEFEDIETNLAFLTPHLEYTNTAVQLYLTRNDITFASFAANANQTSVADVIEAAGIGDPLYDAMVVQSAEGSRAGYDALSGEAYASLGAVLLQQSRYGRDAILERAAGAPEGRGAWAQLLGSSLDFAGNADNAGIESEGRGFIAGADMAANGWRVGAAVTHIASDVEAASLASTADVKSTSISAYGAYVSGPVKATVGASYGRHDIEAERAVVFPGFADATTADFEATGGELFAEVSVAQQVGGVFLQPFVGVGYATLEVDGFTEEGGNAALTVGASERSVTMAKVGLRASTTFESGLGQVTPFGSVALHGVSGDDDQPMDAAFAGAGAYTVSGAPIDDGVAFDFGVRIDGERLGFTAVYSGMEADGWSDQQARVGVSFRF